MTPLLPLAAIDLLSLAVSVGKIVFLCFLVILPLVSISVYFERRLSAVIQDRVGPNRVGVPLTLFNLEPRHVAAIVEMGMNHAGEISRLTDIARPDAGLITVVQPAHIEGLGSIEGVAMAKGELFGGQ